MRPPTHATALGLPSMSATRVQLLVLLSSYSVGVSGRGLAQNHPFGGGEAHTPDDAPASSLACALLSLPC